MSIVNFEELLNKRKRKEFPPVEVLHEVADELERLVTAEREGRLLGFNAAIQFVDEKGEEKHMTLRRFSPYTDNMSMTHELNYLMYKHMKEFDEQDDDEEDE